MNIMDFVTPLTYRPNPVAAAGNAMNAIGQRDERAIQRERLQQQRVEEENLNRVRQQNLWLQGMDFDQKQQDKSLAAFHEYLGLLQAGQPERAQALLPYLQAMGVDVSHPGGTGQGIGTPPPGQEPAAPQAPQDFQTFYKQALASAPAELEPEAPPAKPAAKPSTKGVPPLLQKRMAGEMSTGTPSTDATAPPDEVQGEMQQQERAGIPLPGMPLPDAPPPKTKAPAKAAPAKAQAPAAPVPVEHQAAASHAAAVNAPMPQIHASFRGRDLGWFDPNLPQQRSQADASRIAGEVAGMTPERYRALAEALKTAKTPEEAMAITKAYLEPIISKLLGGETAITIARSKGAAQAGRQDDAGWDRGYDRAKAFGETQKLGAEAQAYLQLEESERMLKSGNGAATMSAMYGIAKGRDPGAIVTNKDLEAVPGIRSVWDKMRDFLEGTVSAEPNLSAEERNRLGDLLGVMRKNNQSHLQKTYKDLIRSLPSMPATRRAGAVSYIEQQFGGMPFYNDAEVHGHGGGPTPEPAPKPAAAPGQPQVTGVRGKGPEGQKAVEDAAANVAAGRPPFLPQ